MPFVQSKRAVGAASASTLAVTLTNPVLPGSTIVVMAGWDLVGAANVTAMASDSLGNSYAPANVIETLGVTPNQRAATFVGKIGVGGPCTVTVAFSQECTNRGAIVHEVSDADHTSPLHVSAAQYQPTPGTGVDAVTSGIQATTVGGCDIVGFTSLYGGGASIAAGTGFIGRDNIGGAFIASEDRVQTTAGPIAATFTIGADSPGLTFMLALKPAPGGPGLVSLPIFWNENIEPNIATYKIYWGQTQSGLYDSPGSPKSVGLALQGTIEIEPNRAAYFAITAVNTNAQESAFSQETTGHVARPRGVKRGRTT